MTDIIIFVILAVILTISISYIVKAKKRGVKCIGCPVNGTCSGKQKEQSEETCTCHCKES